MQTLVILKNGLTADQPEMFLGKDNVTSYSLQFALCFDISEKFLTWKYKIFPWTPPPATLCFLWGSVILCVTTLHASVPLERCDFVVDALRASSQVKDIPAS